MLFTDILIIGGGPAGLSAANMAAKQKARVTILERFEKLGGQLVKQTHRFFGSEKEYAGTRGIQIAEYLTSEVSGDPMVDLRLNTTVIGIYNDGVVTFEQNGRYDKIMADCIIMATGASEKMLLFEGNDLPGVYGAGAAQTLMNLYGVKPGNSVLMVGAGNIGLIVTYQMLQAGIHVEAIVDAAPQIGGYLVHASKVRRLGVPIYTGTTIKEAVGKNFVEKAVIYQLDGSFRPVQGTERELAVDTVCLAVGLAPLSQLLMHLHCRMKYIPSLGGFIPLRNRYLETSVNRVYVAGDVSCIEEASSAMIEGKIAGLSAAVSLGLGGSHAVELREECLKELDELRQGAAGEKIRKGLKALTAC